MFVFICFSVRFHFTLFDDIICLSPLSYSDSAFYAISKEHEFCTETWLMLFDFYVHRFVKAQELYLTKSPIIFPSQPFYFTIILYIDPNHIHHQTITLFNVLQEDACE